MTIYRLHRELCSWRERRLRSKLSHAYFAILLYGFVSSADANQVSHSFSASAGYNNNVGLAPDTGTSVGEELIEIKASRRHSKQLDMSSTRFYAAALNVRRYAGFPLGKATLAFELGYSKKLGLGFDKPRVSLAWKVGREFYQRSNLDCYFSEASVSTSRPFGQNVDTSAGLSIRTEILDQDSFSPANESLVAPQAFDDITTLNLRFDLDYLANSYWSFPASIQLLDGDVASISPIAGLQRTLLRNVVKAKGALATVAANRLLNDGSSVNFELGLMNAKSRQNVRYDRQHAIITWQKNW